MSLYGPVSKNSLKIPESVSRRRKDNTMVKIVCKNTMRSNHRRTDTYGYKTVCWLVSNVSTKVLLKIMISLSQINIR